MLPAVIGCCQQGSGPVPLAVSITVNISDPIIDTAGSGSQTSGLGEIDMAAVPSGGDANYSFAWTLTGENDPLNAFSINMGTTNNADGSWTDAVITTTYTGPPVPGNDPPPPAEFAITCTVTDGTGATATATQSVLGEAT